MNNGHNIKEYIKTMENLKLSVSSRARIKNNLLDYARFHPVRVGEVGRSIEEVPKRTTLITYLFNLPKKSMTAAIIVLMLLVGGGTTFAAEGAVPGDFLYPVKVEVNENIKSAFAISADAEAELQADLLAERVSEVETLKARGDISDEQSLAIAVRVKAQISEAEEAFAASTAIVAGATRAQARVSLEQYNALFASESTLLVDIDSMFSTDTAFGSDIQTEPIDVEFLISSTDVRVTSVAKAITSAGANINASVKAELMAKLDTATNLLVTARSESEAEAREIAFKASRLVGEVEAKLSLLGSVKIDSNTGAIVDIDFSGDTSGGVAIDCDKIPSTMGPESLAWQAQCAGETNPSDETKPSSSIDANLETSVNGSAGSGVNGSIQSSANLGL